MPKLFIVAMPDDFSTSGRVRYRSVDVKTMKAVNEVPEITSTCISVEDLLKQFRAGVKFYKVEG